MESGKDLAAVSDVASFARSPPVLAMTRARLLCQSRARVSRLLSPKPVSLGEEQRGVQP